MNALKIPGNCEAQKAPPISEAMRQKDGRLRKELENAEPENFKKALKPLMMKKAAKGCT